MKAVKKALALFLALLTLASLAGCSGGGEAPDGYKNASNEAADFDFFVPLNWTVSLSDGTIAAYCSANDPSSVSLMPGELRNADTTVEDWWAVQKEEFAKIYTDISDFTVADGVLGGVPGKTYSFTGKLGGGTYYFEITAVVKHGRLYMLTFTSTPELKDDHTKTLESIREYFTFH